jgi:hypothetical protein
MTSSTLLDTKSPIRLGLPLRSSTPALGPMHEFPRRALQELTDALERGFHKELVWPTDGQSKSEPKGEPKAKLDPLGKALLARPIWQPSAEKPGEDLLSAHAPDGNVAKPRETWSGFLDVVGRTVDLEQARERFEAELAELEPMVQTLLKHREVFAYLFARAWFVGGRHSMEAAYRQMVRPAMGEWRHVYDYLLQRSVRSFRDIRRVEFEGKEAAVIAHMTKHEVSLGVEALERGLKAALASVVVGGGVESYLTKIVEKTGALPERVLLQLKNTLQKEPNLDDGKLGFYVAYALELTRSDAPSPVIASDTDVMLDDYAVDYYEDSEAGFEFDRTSVEAAAQLYYAMVMGDELGVFEVIDKIAAQTAPHLELRIRNKDTAQDLQLYVFDEKFRDLKTGGTIRRLSREERHMFFQQVFGTDERLGEGLRFNQEFRTAWKVLMIEVARYIDARTQSRDGLVSPQKVRQAIEDLRYNLSNACSGMPKVAAPVINGELNFVVKRLLESNDVLDQLGRGRGRSFLKVVETVRGTQNLTPLYNKARYGHQILSTIARDGLETTTGLENFVNVVEAYIVAMSQLGDHASTPDPNLHGVVDGANGIHGTNGIDGMNGINGSSGNGIGGFASPSPQDGWNF